MTTPTLRSVVLTTVLGLSLPLSLVAAATPSQPTAGEVLGEPVLTTEGVEVTTYGVVRFPGRQYQGEPEQTMAVHAVRRVEGGTVVYLSMGVEGEVRNGSGQWTELAGPPIGARYTSTAMSSVRIVDVAAAQVLTPLLSPAAGTPAPIATPVQAFPDSPGVMVAAYAVLPELAPGTTTVDVVLGLGRTVTDVPVAEGLLEPAAPADTEPLPLGTAWPEVDLSLVARSPEPELSRHPIGVVRESLGRETTTTEKEESVTVDVAADVLFAVDSAELTAQAAATLQGVGEDVVARAAGGTLQVVGHTDSDASDAYNQDLSQRRAAAAAGVLAPYAEQAGLQLVSQGRGETEPVADNGTEEGRQANRRVSVTFDVSGEGEG